MKVKDIKGKKYNKLTVISFDSVRGKSGHAYWLCKCDCGKEKIVRGSHLGVSTVSCGCHARELSSIILKKYTNSEAYKGKGNPAFLHGDSNTKFHRFFMSANSRCNVKSSGNYNNYGGRGIKFEWPTYLDFKRDMYDSYLEHVKKHGEDQTSLDRIDVNGNYNKKNCKWSTWKQQGNNRRNNRYYIYKGEKKTTMEWSELTKLSYTAFLCRLRKMSFEEAFETPVKRVHKKKLC